MQELQIIFKDVQIFGIYQKNWLRFSIDPTNQLKTKHDFLNCGWMVLNCDLTLVKSTNKASLYTFKKNAFFQNNCFLFKALLKIAKEQAHKGYLPPCRLLHLQLQIEMNICKKKPFWPTCILFILFLLLLLVADWF